MHKHVAIEQASWLLKDRIVQNYYVITNLFDIIRNLKTIVSSLCMATQSNRSISQSASNTTKAWKIYTVKRFA